MEEYSIALYHHGTKGMKWGKRLYQHKDGSLTALGRLRYGKNGSPDGKSSKGKGEDVETTKQKVLATRSAKVLDKNASLFTDQELQRAYQRLELEKKIRDLQPAEKSKGEQFLQNMTRRQNNLSAFMSSGAKVYNNFAKLYNTFSKSTKYKAWPLIDDKVEKKGGIFVRNKDKDNDKKKDTNVDTSKNKSDSNSDGYKWTQDNAWKDKDNSYRSGKGDRYEYKDTDADSTDTGRTSTRLLGGRKEKDTGKNSISSDTQNSKNNGDVLDKDGNVMFSYSSVADTNASSVATESNRSRGEGYVRKYLLGDGG